MKAFICVILFAYSWSSTAQPSPMVLTKVTGSELAKLKPTTGMMVYNTSDDAIYYYGNNGWFAFTGECMPKPVSPTIDSAFVADNRLYVFFSPVNPLLNYIIEDGGSGLLGTVSSSPAVLDLLEMPRSITVRAKSKCGSSGPLELFPVETRVGQ